MPRSTRPRARVEPLYLSPRRSLACAGTARRYCARRSSSAIPEATSRYFGSVVGRGGPSIACIAGDAHPHWYVDRSGVPFYDVAYLTLASDAPVAPVAWQSTELPNVVGQSVQMVGYGVNDAERPVSMCSMRGRPAFRTGSAGNAPDVRSTRGL